MDRPKFLVDRMLGRLVAWLRIFGYDTKSALELTFPGDGDSDEDKDEDARLVALAREEGRVLLTRDRELCQRARKAGVTPVLILADDAKGQICALLRHYPLSTEPVMDRCTACNGPLHRAAASDAGRVRAGAPEHLVAEGKEFWVCDRCGKVYWLGSHWRNIQRMSEELKDCRR